MNQGNKDCESVRERDLIKEFAVKYHDTLEKAAIQQERDSDVDTRPIRLRSKEYSEGLPKKKSRMVWKVVFILLTIVVFSSGLTIWVNSTPANAARFNVQKVFLNIKNLFVNDPQEVSVEDQPYISWETESEEEMDVAKRFAPELAIPGYIPEGFKLVKLKIKKDLNNFCTMEYHYANSVGNHFWITEFNELEDEIIEVYGEGEEYEKNRKNYRIWKDEISENLTVYAIINGIFVSVFGELSEEELLKIAEMIE